MQVIAYYDDAYTTPSVDVTNGSIADIQSGIINDYNISFRLTQSGGSEITKLFSVVSDEAVVTSNNLGYIQANDLVISTTEAQTLNSASDLIALMQAKGYMMELI